MSRRAFRPTMDRLETLCLLDGSSPTGPLYPPPAPPADSSSSPGSDPEMDALAAQAAALAADDAASSIHVSVPGMTMTSKDDEIKAINDDRAAFNAKVDAAVVKLNGEIADAKASIAFIEAKVIGMDVSTPDLLAKSESWLRIEDLLVQDVKGFQDQIDGLAKLRVFVNDMLDQDIRDIKGTEFVYNGVVLATYYTNAPFSV